MSFSWHSTKIPNSVSPRPAGFQGPLFLEFNSKMKLEETADINLEQTLEFRDL